jgi:glycosyltransferase involved in cell wall biosynthesis
MKIAYIHDVIYPYVKGGAEKRVWEMARRLAARGHEVHIFGMKYWDGDDVIEREGVHLHGVCDPQDLYVDGKRSIKTSLHFSWKLLWSFKGGFDVVDAQQFPYFPCFSAKFHSYLRKTPLVITWYEVWDDYWYEYLGRKGFIGKWIEKWTTKLPYKIVPISERIRDDLVSIGVGEDRMEVLPNGVDYSGIQQIKGEKDFFDVLYAGRLSEHKNVDLLLEAVDQVRDVLPSIKCGIIGDGPERDKLVKMTEELSLGDNVKFLGFLEKDEEVMTKMKSAKVFVLPSSREGFPNTILEANACGVPVIVVDSDKNAGVEAVKDGVNGAVCRLSADSMATSIIRLLDGGLYKKMSDQSRENARKHDWDIIVNKIEMIYDGLVR